MSSYPESPLEEVLEPSSAYVQIEPDAVYATAGIYSYGRGLFKRPLINGSETNYSRYNKLKVGQFVYSKLFGWEGALATVPEEFDGFYVSHEFPTFEIRAERIDPRYMDHLVKWEGLHAKLRDQGAGMGSRRQRVNVDRLLAATVPLPGLLEQRRVADYLDSTLARVRRVEELRLHRAKLHAAFAESRISEAIAGKVEQVKVGSIICLERRQVILDAGKMYREIGLRSFGRGVFHKDPISGSELGGKRVFMIEPGDLLLSNVFAWEGAIALASETERGFVGSHRFMTYRVDSARADASYMRHFLASRTGLEVIRRASPGSAGRNRTLGIKAFEAETIPLPPLPVQMRVSALLDTLAIKLTVKDTTAVISALHPSLLNTAFSGQM